MTHQRHPDVIVGLGQTGLSYARYLASRGVAGAQVQVLDDAPAVDRRDALNEILPGADLLPLTGADLTDAGAVYVSPGVPLSHHSLQGARKAGVPLHGDVALFAELADAPIVAITGTNGKSTVADLCHYMMSAQVEGVRLCGNIGTPCLDVLSDEAAFYVLEASSYQLELATELDCQVAVVLNLAPDHEDRYPSLDDYYNTKLALYRHAASAVINRDIPQAAIWYSGTDVLTFGSDDSDEGFGLRDGAQGAGITLNGKVVLWSNDLLLRGRHNLLNVQVALAVSELLGLDLHQSIDAVCRYGGLPHRSQVVAVAKGVTWINDSKATNPAAMVAAVTGAAAGCNVHLIAGGASKGARFDEAAEQLRPFIKSLHVIGESAAEISRAFSGMHLFNEQTLEAAVAGCAELAEPGDIVLLSPGCASFDQFRNYVARGDAFVEQVEALL